MLTDLRYALGQLRKAQAYAAQGTAFAVMDCIERAADGLERCIDAATHDEERLAIEDAMRDELVECVAVEDEDLTDAERRLCDRFKHLEYPAATDDDLRMWTRTGLLPLDDN